MAFQPVVVTFNHPRWAQESRLTFLRQTAAADPIGANGVRNGRLTERRFRPVLQMQLHEAHGPRHGFGLGRQLVDGEAPCHDDQRERGATADRSAAECFFTSATLSLFAAVA